MEPLLKTDEEAPWTLCLKVTLLVSSPVGWVTQSVSTLNKRGGPQEPLQEVEASGVPTLSGGSLSKPRSQKEEALWSLCRRLMRRSRGPSA